MAHQSMSLMDTFENDNETFKALTVHFVQKEIMIIPSVRMDYSM